MWSNEYIRVPFVEHGRSREGSDCWGLITLIYFDKLGLTLPSLNDYPDTKDKKSIPSIIESECSKWIKIEKGEEQEFDVAVFKMAGNPMHVGLVVKKGLMLHCEYGSGTRHVHYDKEQQWYRRLIGFYRYAQCSDSLTSVQSST